MSCNDKKTLIDLNSSTLRKLWNDRKLNSTKRSLCLRRSTREQRWRNSSMRTKSDFRRSLDSGLIVDCGSESTPMTYCKNLFVTQENDSTRFLQILPLVRSFGFDRLSIKRWLISIESILELQSGALNARSISKMRLLLRCPLRFI